MALPPESATDKLLREMRQRDQLLQRLGRGGPLEELAQLERARESFYRATAISPNDRMQEITEGARSRSNRVADLASRGMLDQAAQVARQQLGSMDRAAQGLASDALRRVNEAAQGYVPTLQAEPRLARPTGQVPRTANSPLTSAAELGQMIRRARKAMKLNQAQFAAQAGVGRRFLSELEGGKPSLEFDKVLACAAAAGIDLLARARRG